MLLRSLIYMQSPPVFTDMIMIRQFVKVYRKYQGALNDTLHTHKIFHENGPTIVGYMNKHSRRASTLFSIDMTTPIQHNERIQRAKAMNRDHKAGWGENPACRVKFRHQTVTHKVSEVPTTYPAIFWILALHRGHSCTSFPLAQLSYFSSKA